MRKLGYQTCLKTDIKLNMLPINNEGSSQDFVKMLKAEKRIG